MIGTLYEIRARYMADTAGATQQVDRLANSNDAAARGVDRLTSRFANLASVAIPALTGVATLGVGLLVREMIRLNKEASDAQIGVASVLSINGLGTFEQGMTRASGLMKRFRKEALTSPGGSADIQNIFTRIAPQLARFNPSDSEIAKFSSRGVAAAFTLMGGDINTTGDQLSQIMMGQAGADNKLFQSIRAPLLKNAGITEKDPQKAVEAFNKLTAKDPRKVFDALNKTFSSLDSALLAFSNTITGRFSSLQEIASNWLKDMSGPLFERVNQKLGDLLRWADGAQDKIDALAKSVGRTLADGFDRAARMALSLIHI